MNDILSSNNIHGPPIALTKIPEFYNVAFDKIGYELIKFADPLAIAIQEGLTTSEESLGINIITLDSTVPQVSVVRVSYPPESIGFGFLELKLDGFAARQDYMSKMESLDCREDISGNVTFSVENKGPLELSSQFTLNFTFSNKDSNTKLINECIAKKEENDRE